MGTRLYWPVVHILLSIVSFSNKSIVTSQKRWDMVIWNTSYGIYSIFIFIQLTVELHNTFSEFYKSPFKLKKSYGELWPLISCLLKLGPICPQIHGVNLLDVTLNEERADMTCEPGLTFATGTSFHTAICTRHGTWDRDLFDCCEYD